MTKRPPPHRWETAHQSLILAKAEVKRRSAPKRTIIVSPPVLDIGGATFRLLLHFLAAIRTAVLVRHLEITIDLRPLRRISPAATLLLAAEVERCNYLKPRSVWGYEPIAEEPQIVLAALGFHDAVGSPHPASFDEWEGIAKIQSGSSNPADLARKLGQVAALAQAAWADDAFCNRVHGALNEAMTNVIMHAYDPSLNLNVADLGEEGRWWVAGFAEPDTDHVWFMALDHGVGIPVSAPARNQDVRNYLAELQMPSDERIIYSVVASEGRSRTGLPQHGKGVPAMIALIKDLAVEGSIWIMSGGGGFLLDKHAADKTSPSRIYEMPFTLPARMSGTLILWKVGQPISSMKPQ